MAKLTHTQRQRMSSEYHSGASSAALCRKYDVAPSTVKRWVEEGLKKRPCWLDMQRAGRKPQVNKVMLAALKPVAKQLKTAAGVKLKTAFNRQSLSTIRRSLRLAGLVYRPVRHGRLLSPTNKAARMSWCRDHWSDPSTTAVYIDSKKIFMQRDKARNVKFAWQARGKTITYPAASNPACYHFYAAIATGFKSTLVFVPPTPQHPCGKGFTKEAFLEAFLELMEQIDDWATTKRSARYTIIMDHARQHDNAFIRSELASMGAPVDWSFPAQSYDLNLIENAWGMMAQAMQGGRPRTHGGYLKALKAAWSGLNQRSLDALMRLSHKRRQLCIENQGAWPQSI